MHQSDLLVRVDILDVGCEFCEAISASFSDAFDANARIPNAPPPNMTTLLARSIISARPCIHSSPCSRVPAPRTWSCFFRCFSDALDTARFSSCTGTGRFSMRGLRSGDRQGGVGGSHGETPKPKPGVEGEVAVQPPLMEEATAGLCWMAGAMGGSMLDEAD